MFGRNITRPTRRPTIKLLSALGWPKGLQTKYDPFQTEIQAIRTGENVKLTGRGSITPRPGLKLYGTQPTGTIIGQMYEYTRTNSGAQETWLMWMENRSGTGTVITSKDGGAHTVVTGATYLITGNPHFEQVAGKVLIMTGKDALSYMDVQTQTITTFTALTTPAAPTATPTGFTGTATVTYNYRITAANQGETAASVAGSAAVPKIRETWNGSTENVSLTWNRVTGAVRYNIYLGTQAGQEYFIDSVTDPGSGTTVTYNDFAQSPQNIQRLAPVSDSTAGPKTTRGTNIKGQVYMTGDTDNPGRIWFGGDSSVNALDFSWGNGGGYVEPNKGGKDVPVRVVAFRDGKGTPMAACLSKGTNGAGKRYLLSPQSTTLGNTVISYMAVQEDNGGDGTDSPDGVVFLNDALWYPSRSSFKTTNTKPQIQNILSTSGITDDISPDVQNLNSQYMASCVGIAYDQTIYWALPYSTTSNSQIWVLDFKQGGAWMRPWYIPASWMVLYAENSTGASKFLILSNNKIYELDPTTNTNDNAVSFQTSVGSGSLKFNDDGSMWANVIDVTFVYLHPQGNISMGVQASGEDGDLQFAGTLPATSGSSVSAYGRFGWGGSGWGQLAPRLSSITSSLPLKRWRIEVDEECNSVSWSVQTSESGVNYELVEVVIRYVEVGLREVDNI